MGNEVYLVPRDELYHYGVKGMKWGVRKYTKGEAKAMYRQDVRAARKKYKKAIKGKEGAAVERAAAKYDAAKKTAKEQYKSNRKERITIKESIERRDARVKDSAEKYGYLGTMATATSGAKKYAKRSGKRAMLAKVLNSSANAYITSSKGSYAAKRGADYVRRAGIGALSLADNADKIMYYRDVYNSMYYSSNRYRNK